MPPATRSKKIFITEDDLVTASQVPLPNTPRKERLALAEISINPEKDTMTAEEANMAAQLKGLKAAYKTAIGVKRNKKGKAKKAAKKQLELAGANNSPEVVNDEQPAVVSPATTEARRLLSSDEEESPATEEDKTKSSPSPAVRQTRQKLANTKAVAGTDGSAEISISPKKTAITSLEAVEKAYEAQDSIEQTFDGTGEDSFVEQITTRSPAKPVSRIEDSVEALDKMEEAIEALGEAALAVSPAKTILTAPTQKETSKAAAKPFSSLRVKLQDPGPNIKTIASADVQANERVKKSKSTSALRDACKVSEGKVFVAKKLVKRPASLLPPKESVKSAKPPTKPDFELPGEAIARKLKEQREARKAKRESSEEGSTRAKVPTPGTRVKSAKPPARLPTKPAFELPGEALSRKKREAYEARLKTQEEEERKRRQFKAKPLRKSIQPDFVPRETVASLARKSLVIIQESDLGAANQRNSVGASKHASIVGARRTSIQAANLANTSAPRAPGLSSSPQPPDARKASTTNGLTMSGLAMQRTVSASEVQLQRQRAKEIYMRDIKALEEMEREKKEREAAAKKSRLEAAERGRQASREWAEKQRAKKAAEGDKGLSPGYGPGGQLGLKA